MEVKVELTLEFDDNAKMKDIRAMIEGKGDGPSMWYGLGTFIEDHMPEYTGLLEGSWVTDFGVVINKRRIARSIKE